MGKYLNGSVKTGEKIQKNRSEFHYSFNTIDDSCKNILYRFSWQFNSQHGYVSIIFDKGSGKISNSSLIDTDNSSSYKFDRPLGLYNDNSLYSVFQEMMKTRNIDTVGVFTDN